MYDSRWGFIERVLLVTEKYEKYEKIRIEKLEWREGVGLVVG